jgi:acyl-CoA synthetase (NDP forming)
VTSATVRAMLEARTVAVVGASARPMSFGQQLLTEITRGDPSIQVFPVNPRYDELAGRPCLPSLADLPGPVDLVLLGVPNASLEAQLALAAEAGARAAVIYASGYEPTTPGTAPLVDRLAAIARTAGMAVCGGNCMGFWNLDQGVRALGFQENDVPPRGPVTFLSHSGSAFSALLRNNRGIGFNLVVSAGQEFVTSLADYLDYAVDQPTTRVVAMLMETARDPARLKTALLRAAEADIPVVALKVGRSRRSQELVVAHSGALAGEDAAYDALFDAYQVLRVDDLDELCDTVELLAARRRAASGALAAVHDSGAERALVVDVADAVGAPFAELSPATLDRLDTLLDPGLEATNPLDVWGTGADTRTLFATALVALAQDPAVAAVAVGLDLVREFDGELAYMEAAIDAAAATTKPVALLSNAHSSLDAASALMLRDAGVPVLEGTRSGLVALRLLLHLRDLRARPAVPLPAVVTDRRDRWVARLSGPPLSAVESLELLAEYGVPVVRTLAAASRTQALTAAEAIGYPVVLKTDEPSIAHKSDADGVRLGIGSPAELGAAYDDVAGRLGPAVSVSAMVEGGVELALGVVNDVQLGPLVLVAAGGVLVEVLHDRALAVPPLDEARASALVERLRVRTLLAGVRGQPAADLSSVTAAVVALSVLACELGDAVDAIDVNPLVCGSSGAVAVDALVVQRTYP